MIFFVPASLKYLSEKLKIEVKYLKFLCNIYFKYTYYVFFKLRIIK